MWRKINGYVLTIGSGLTLLAGALLLALQWGNSCGFSFYGKNISLNTGLVIACAMLAGWLTPKVCRVLFKGISKIRKARKEYKKL
ncbi:MAG: hypothetical protein HN350_04680 [Phycisphaerales bacterium]|jgi:hypothetical protein|nr:hypothetical protein [Phycisphaerales bacterium]